MRLKERSKKKLNTTGSSLSDEPVFLAIGRLRRPFGLSDEWLFKIMTDFPDRLILGKELYLGRQKQAHTIKTIVISNQYSRISLCPAIEHDKPYQNEILYVKADEVPPLPNGQYYHHQVIGLRVEDENGASLGVLAEILETGANDVYVIRPPEGKEILIPAIGSVVKTVNLKDRLMVVKIPEWI